MKKVLKYLTLIMMVLCFNAKSVEALSTDKTIVYNRTRDHYVQVSNLYTGNYVFKTSLYELTGNGETYISYCMDPHKAASDKYTLDRILGDSGSIGVQAFDMGILEILKHAYTQINNSYSLQSTVTPETTPNKYNATVSGDNLYASSSIAIRAFILGLYGWGGGGIDKNTYMKTQASAHVNLGINWSSWYGDAPQKIFGVTCSGQADCQQKYLNARKSSYSWFLPSVQMHGWTYGTTSYDVIYAAQELFYHAIDAAMEVYDNGGINSSTVKGEITSTAQDGKRTDEQVQEYIYANLELNGFTEEAYIKNFNFSCPSCSASGVTYDGMEYYNANNEWVSLTPDMDLSKTLEANEEGIRSGTIRIRVHITKTVMENEEDCKNASYEITYDYFDPNKEYIGGLLKDKNKSDKQRMVVISKTDGQASKGSIPGSIGCANAVCDTELSVPICSDDENEAISEITANEKIKKCILDNVDDAGNSYQLSDENGGVENDYCKIFCKEDYKDVIDDGVPGGIKLNPVVEDVECGGFFQLTSHIEGKKDCYTGGTSKDKSINKEKYLEDIKAVQENLVDAMNRYYMYKAMSEHQKETLTNNVSQSCTCGGSAYGDTINVSWDSYDEVTFSWDQNAGNGSYSYGTHEGGSDSWDDNCWCNGECACGTDSEGNPKYCSANPTCDNNASSQYSAWVAEVNQGLATAKQDLNDYYKEYVRIITDYNGCTAAWTMEFPFEQRLKFYYSEYHYKDEYTPYYDLIEAAEDEDLYYLDAVEDSLIEEQEVEICKGDTNDKYECSTQPLTFDSVESEPDEWNYVPEYGSSVYSNKSYVVCSVENGCRTDNRMISDAKFIRKTVKKSQDYITPTVFYQIEANGRVTVNSGYTGNALKLDALINSLPISTSATGGGIFKLLLEDLGEFYDTGETGRLIDFGGDHESESVAVAVGNEGIETFDGEYTCYYESPCRPKDCPDCEFICDEDECYWGDPGSCPDCVFECVNCIFNLDELVLNFKPITTVDVTAPDREFGYNWDISTSLGALELLRDKAELTINEIEEENETIYDKTGEDSALSFSIRMTPDVINYLKDYNESVENTGGYANDSLTCYAATIDGKSYANIFCYSEVIDYLVDNYGNQITVGNRTPEESRSDENNRANSNGYWSLWDWTEPARDENGQYSIIGGPSWK